MRLPAVSSAAMRALMLLLALLATATACHRQPVALPLAEGAVKILVQENGLYTVERSALQQAGLVLNSLDAGQIRLSQGGTAVPYLLEEDRLIFYGQVPTGRYTSLAAYILESGGPGLLMAERPAPPLVAAAVPVAAAARAVTQRLYLEQNLLYDSQAAGAANPEPWYWQTLQPQSKVTIEIEIPALAPGAATLRLGLWGASRDTGAEFDHDFDLVVNGRRLETIQWQGSVYHVSESRIPEGTLQVGRNNVTLDNSVPGMTLIDIMRLDWLELTYPAPPVARDELFEMRGAGATVTIDGFRHEPLLFDVANPAEPVRLTGNSFSGGQVQVALAAETELIAAGRGALRSPVAITRLRQSRWQERDHRADLIILTTDELAPALQPLVEARRQEGLAVVVVIIDELYDEFTGGAPIPEAITAFLRYALANWSEPAPRYLLLVGEATYDYRGYLGPAPRNHVPTLLVPITHGGETVSDSRLADVNGDLRPDLAIGRWPAGDSRVVSDLVRRTLAYEQGPAPLPALFVADGTGRDFAAMMDDLLAASDFSESEVRKLYGAPSDEVVQAWNQGAWLVTYTGHGSLDRWGKEDVLSMAAVEKLQANSAAAIVLQLTCLTGFFAHPKLTSLSQAMLAQPHGPVLLVAATSLTLSSSQAPFAAAFLREVQDPQVTRIGDALQRARQSLDVAQNDAWREISDTFGLLGDPSASIVRPDR